MTFPSCLRLLLPLRLPLRLPRGDLLIVPAPAVAVEKQFAGHRKQQDRERREDQGQEAGLSLGVNQADQGPMLVHQESIDPDH